MKKHAAAARHHFFSLQSLDRLEKTVLYPLIEPLEFVFCFGGWTASCVALFHVIVSIYGTEMTGHPCCSCPGMTGEEAAVMRAVEAQMLLCCAAQMAAALAAMTASRRVARRACASAALALGGATVWLWCLYLRFVPGLRCFRCFGAARRVAVVFAAFSLATPALVLIPRGLHEVVFGDGYEQQSDDY
uniref:Uncharacterized protein n=1 Tax=Leersia perrieri TaxID=77586 RepID=A0A0D9W4U3_9ORYZ